MNPRCSVFTYNVGDIGSVQPREILLNPFG
jgi:hypothetical protein